MNKKLAKVVLLPLAFLFIFGLTAAAAREKASSAQTTTKPTETTETSTTETSTGSSANPSDNYQKIRTEWQNRIKEMKTQRATITAEQKKANLEIAKTMVQKAIDKAVFRLKKIKTRISKTKVITNDRKTKLIAQIEEQITALNSLEEKVGTVTTKDELKSLTLQVKAKLSEIRKFVKEIVAEILASHIDKTITKLNTIATKIETEISTLKTQGQDVTAMEKTLNEAKDLINQAQTKNQAGDWREARKLAEQARAKLVKLAGEIKAAKAKLKGGTNETK